MAEKILDKQDPKLKSLTVEHDSPAPREIPQDEFVMRRVGRPLRHVKHIPVKSLMFYSKHHTPHFSYETKIRTPIDKGKLVVQVRSVGFNPLDLKIINGFTSNMNFETGIGREYSGVISEVGDDLRGSCKEGDEVYGLYFHLYKGMGTLASSILVDPTVDIIVPKPPNLSFESASGSLYCLGAAFNILDKLEQQGSLNENSVILINGGTTSVGIFALQLLKYHYRVQKKVVIVTSGYGSVFLKSKFPDLVDEMLFINYTTCSGGKIHKPLESMINNSELIDYDSETGQPISTPYDQGKFTVILDFIGGYDLVAHTGTLLKSSGSYVTTVGDYKANYTKDYYNTWDTPRANARKLFGKMLWSLNYTHFDFDPSVKSAQKNDWVSKCAELLESETVKCVVDKVYNWKRHEEAFGYLKRGHAHGKVILNVEKF